jgi:hypothetical protein
MPIQSYANKFVEPHHSFLSWALKLSVPFAKRIYLFFDSVNNEDISNVF